MALLEELIPKQTFPIGTGFIPLEEKEGKALVQQRPEDITALKIVTQDVSKAEAWLLQKGFLIEWNQADRLYLFQVPIAYWEGTLIPRAHLGMPLVYEHVESILPQVVTGLFGDDPPFMSRPRPATSMQAARANDALLTWELKQANFREELRLGIKSALIYGTGIFKWGWKYSSKTKTKYRRKQAQGIEPLAFGAVRTPASDETEPYQVAEEENHPTFEAVNIRHILVDPGTRTQDIRTAKFVIHRLYLTVDQLDSLRDQEGYNLPPKEQLIRLFFPPAETVVDSKVEGQYGIDVSLQREFQARPRNEQTTIDVTKQPLEVLEYWNKERVYVVLQRRVVIRNEANEYGEIPFCSIAYTDVPDSFYGIGVAKLIGNEQRMQQGVINTFLDELALSLNGMFIRRRGTNTPTQQLRMRPGGVIDTDDAEGVQVLARQPLPIAETANVLASSDARAQRRTAANELVVQGALPAARSSITRTATGVQALTGGSGARLQYFIENLASLVFIPTLDVFHKMNATKLKPSQIEKILSNELGKAYEGDVLDLINGEYDFDIVAAAKLQSRRTMTQMIPMLYQFILTEPVMSALQQQGKKVNVVEMVNMLYDVSGWPNRQDVIVDMSQEDEQRALMNNPMVQQLITSNAQNQQKLDSQKQIIEEQNVARAGRDVIRELVRNATTRALGEGGGGGE